MSPLFDRTDTPCGIVYSFNGKMVAAQQYRAFRQLSGTRLAQRFSQEMLKRSFGGFLVIVATYILIKSAP